MGSTPNSSQPLIRRGISIRYSERPRPLVAGTLGISETAGRSETVQRTEHPVKLSGVEQRAAALLCQWGSPSSASDDARFGNVSRHRWTHSRYPSRSSFGGVSDPSAWRRLEMLMLVQIAGQDYPRCEVRMFSEQPREGPGPPPAHMCVPSIRAGPMTTRCEHNRGQHHNCTLSAAGISSRERPLVGPETAYGVGAKAFPYPTQAPAGTCVASSALFVIYRRRARRLKVFGSCPFHTAALRFAGRQNGSGCSTSWITPSPASEMAVTISLRFHCHSTAPLEG